MIRDLHFPTPIYTFYNSDNSFNQELEKNILQWMKEDKGVSRTNVKGWHSTTDMHQKPEYKKLTEALFEAQFKIYKEEYLESEPYLGGMWANVNPPGGMNRAHQHPNSLWSGVYYVKTPENCGKLMLYDPRDCAAIVFPRQQKGKLPNRLYREIWYKPEAGKCIMFPSWLMHAVDPNESNELRISVSFNFTQSCMMV
jgi:uncharacterized protein (TIGR02466 family)|tara:strand:- start:2632 stop:3222 length:591 start_codon:yes stop_codon:yes gene_type:complete